MTLRRLLLKVHLYLGLLAGLIVVVVGITGAILVFEQELDRALHPELWAVNPEGASPRSLESIMGAVREAYPDRAFLTIAMSADPGRPYVVSTENEFQVFVDPYSGRILGSREYTQTFFGLMFSLHRTLLAGDLGRRLVGIATLLVLFLVLSGLYLWWPRTRARIKSSFRIHWSAGWKRLTYDLHNVVGFYSSGSLILIALTGLVWSFSVVHDAIFWLTGSPPPPWKARLQSVVIPGVPVILLDQALRKADELVPGAQATEMLLPQRPEDPIQVVKRVPRATNPNAQSFVSLDQYSGEVLQVARYEDNSWGATIRLLVYPIHVGSIFGLPTQILALLVSAFVPISAVTGFLIWWNRRRALPVSAEP